MTINPIYYKKANQLARRRDKFITDTIQEKAYWIS